MNTHQKHWSLKGDSTFTEIKTKFKMQSMLWPWKFTHLFTHWNKKTPAHILQMSIKSIAYLMQHSFGYFSRILAIFDISGFSLSTIHELKPPDWTVYTLHKKLSHQWIIWAPCWWLHITLGHSMLFGWKVHEKTNSCRRGSINNEKKESLSYLLSHNITWWMFDLNT